MEINASGKHTSLLQYGNNYYRKNFYSTGCRWNCLKRSNLFQVSHYGTLPRSYAKKTPIQSVFR